MLAEGRGRVSRTLRQHVANAEEIMSILGVKTLRKHVEEADR